MLANRTVPVLVALHLALGLAAGGGAPLGAAEELATLRADLEAIVTARDAALERLNARLERDSQQGPLLDLRLDEEHHHAHEPMRMDLTYCGGRFHGAGAFLKSYNQAEHRIDASGLRLEGERLTGTLVITLRPDQWVPPDHTEREQTHHIDARIDGSAVVGSYRYTGHLGPDKDRLSGTVARREATVSVAGPSGTETVADGPAGAVELGRLSAQAYRQLWAAAFALHAYPVSYQTWLERNLVGLPEWSVESDAVTDIKQTVARMAACARRFDPAAPAAGEFAQGFCGPADQRFGPFFATSALEQGADGVAVLPEATGTPGAQRWQYVPRWTILGPFPAPNRTDHILPGLPEAIPPRQARYALRTVDFGRDFVHPDWLSEEQKSVAYHSYSAADWLKNYIASGKPETAQAYTYPAETRSGRWGTAVMPPRWCVTPTKVPVYGATRSSYFASTLVRSEVKRTVWVEANCQDAGQLWINDRLAWHSQPDLEDRKRVKWSIFPIELEAGENTVMVRCRNDDPATSVRVLFCTRGQPDPDPVAQVAAGVDASAVHLGFRGNGTGRFPAPAEGHPPLAWDIETGTNVRWTLPLPSYSHSYPLIVGDRIFTNSEPHWLYCIDKMSGEVLWKRASNLAGFFAPEDRELGRQGYALLAGSNLETEVRQQAAALEDEKMEVDLALREDDLDAARRTELRKRSRDLRNEISELVGRRNPGLRTLSKYNAGRGGWHRFTGLTMPTPVSDGEHIWVKYAHGVVACYDLAGERRWIVDTKLRGNIAGVSSPVLVGDILIVEGGPKYRAKAEGRSMTDLAREADVPTGKKQDLHYVVALNASTGEERWNRVVKCGIGGYGTPGGPRALRLRGPEGPVDVVVTQRMLLAAADGRVLSDSCRVSPGYAGFVDDGILYGGSSSVTFWAEATGQVGIRYLVNGGGGYTTNGCVLAADGRFYGNPDSRVKAGRTAIPWQTLSVVDAASGKQVFKQEPCMEDVGNDYTPPAACGSHVYLTDTGNGSTWRAPGGGGGILVVETGDPPRLVARSSVEGMAYSGPVFDGSRMYLRTRASLTCFETTTEEGRRLEYEKSVLELFDVCSRLPLTPQIERVVDLPPDEDYTPGAGVPVTKVYGQMGPSGFLVLGPFPPEPAGKDHLESAGGCAGVRPEPGATVGSQTWKPLAPELFTHASGLNEDLYGRDRFSSRTAIDLTAVTDGKGGAAHYFYTVMEVTRPKVLRYTNAGRDFATWIAGTPIEHEQRFRVSPGYYPILIRTSLGRLPPFAAKRTIAAEPHFVQVSDPLDKVTAWRAQIEPYRARLREVVERWPGKWAFEARTYLQRLGEAVPSVTDDERSGETPD
ncbi:MAG: hypothetical protein ACOCYP_05265 [Planctomycetota bacterium]